MYKVLLSWIKIIIHKYPLYACICFLSDCQYRKKEVLNSLQHLLHSVVSICDIYLNMSVTKLFRRSHPMLIQSTILFFTFRMVVRSGEICNE